LFSRLFLLAAELALPVRVTHKARYERVKVQQL
jgi:hypothetical protein